MAKRTKATKVKNILIKSGMDKKEAGIMSNEIVDIVAGKNKIFEEEYQYPSITTEGFSHEQPECFAAELLTYRHAITNGDKLPDFFWRSKVECSEAYKKEFKDSLECARKLINVGIQPHFIIQCFFYAKGIKYCQYGLIIDMIKKKWTTWKANVIKRFVHQVDEMVTNRDIMMNISEVAKQIENNGLNFETVKKTKKIKF